MTALDQLACAALAVTLAAALGAPPAYANASDAQPASIGREATLTEYRQHLVELNAVVEACAKARNSKACESALAGQDDRVLFSNAPNAERNSHQSRVRDLS